MPVHFSKHNIEIHVDDKADDEYIRFIEEMVLGTEGGFRYGHSGQREKIQKLKDTVYFTLRRKGKLIGTIGLSNRMLNFGGSIIKTVHVRFFRISLAFERIGRSLAQKASKTSPRSKGGNILKSIVAEIFDSPALIVNDANYGDKPLIVNAFVEEQNLQSLNMVEQHGFQKIGVVRLLLFSRFIARKNPGVEQLSKTDVHKMKELLDDYYKAYNFYSSASLDLPDNYYVIKEGNEILTGVHAQKTIWKIKEMPNRMGLVLLRIISVIPGLNKSFNPKQLSFLSLYGLYCKTGYEKRIPVLFEGICQMLEVKMAFYWDDDKSMVLQHLYKSKKMGWFKNVFKNVRGYLFVKLFNVDPTVVKTLAQKPFYIHPGDLS